MDSRQVDGFAGPVVVEEADDDRSQGKGVGREAEDPGADAKVVYESVAEFGG